MSKQLNIQYEGKNYTLEFTRKSVEMMEQQGFVAEDIKTKPMSTLPALFAGAFMAHHKWGVSQETIDEIYKHIPNKSDFIGKLAEMYNEPFMALLEEPEEDEGNAIWTVNW